VRDFTARQQELREKVAMHFIGHAEQSAAGDGGREPVSTGARRTRSAGLAENRMRK
jgi:hypothetical protein